MMLAAILLAPLVGFLLNGLFGKRFPRPLVSVIGCGSILISFVLSFYFFLQFLEEPESWRNLSVVLFSWIPQLGVDIGLKLDALSQLMLLVVTGVSFLIHLYSVNYMENDPGFSRYFSYLNLFSFSMLLLVLAHNLLALFIGWEGVGLCSYLLIGFWFEDDEKAKAGKKAFIVNRIGDFAFLIALFLTYTTFGTLNIDSLHAYELTQNHASVITMITLLLFMGACGKSAQIPLYVWLPDAMAGPTPVSALIHAATMVTAGVYMIARLHFFYSLAPITSFVVASVGMATALFAATIGFFQNDIKKVLAYSTISQLGYMFLAVGVGAYTAGIFHLITHAFFKALLFLAAGSVIHSLHGEQDIQKMGALQSKLPLTHVVFLFGTLAIIGIPPFSGFFSKDEILWMAFNYHPAFWVLGWIGALMTTFYMVRLFTLTFYGKNNGQVEHPHEAPPLMALSLIILSLLSLGGGLIGVPQVLHGILPLENFLDQFLSPMFEKSLTPHGSLSLEYGLMGVMTLSSLATAIFTFLVFHKKQALTTHLKLKYTHLHTLVSNKYYVDEIYSAVIVTPLKKVSELLLSIVDLFIIDGSLNGLANLSSFFGFKLSQIQSGNLQTYALAFILGVVGILFYLARVL